MNIESVIIEAAEPAAAERFYTAAFDLGDRLRVRSSDAPSTGFRGFTISLVVSQPGNVNAIVDSALAAGATTLKPVSKSLWGVGGTVQAPDGTIWKVATSAKKDTEPVSRAFDQIVVLLGVEDVAASKRFYTDHGLQVGKSFGSYADFAMPTSPVKLGLYRRRALAKDAGVPEDGAGSHRIALVGDGAGFADPDGFTWEARVHQS